MKGSGWSNRTTTAVLALCAALLIAGRAGASPVICFPPGGGGVPGQPGLPDWWSGGTPAPSDDPRWVGSYGYSDGTVNFSALVESGTPNYLVLRWHVNPDPGAALPGDQVLVGFYNPTGTVGTVFQLTRDATSTTAGAPPGAGVMTVNAFGRAGAATIWTAATVPSGITADARLDASCTGSGFPYTCDDWVIRMRVPMTAASGGVDLSTTFSMWYEVDVQHGDTGTTDQSKFPSGAINADLVGFPPTIPEPLGSVSPASAAWNPMSVAGGSCVTGIVIDHGDITVSNTIGAAGTTIDVNSANNFDVKPTNQTMANYAGNAIQANLRIADWGSAVGDSPQWITVPGTGCATATGVAATMVGGGHQFDLNTCSWTLTAAQKCDFRPDLFPGCTPDALGTRDAHQCILAELSSTGLPIQFNSQSSWNNFNFDHSSKLERKARIDIGALGPRDVYVYIKALNLPETVSETPPPPPPQQTPGAAGELSAAARAKMGELAAVVPGRVTEKESQGLQALVASGRIGYDDVAKVMPTITAYVWHDSGTTMKTKTGTAKILTPQPSFTLFVSHDGPLHGWRHAFAGLGGTVITEIAPNFYRIGVGSTGSVQVLTSVEAIEKGSGRPLWIYLLALLILLLLIWIVRRIMH
jgi:hypothetical protein